MTGRERVRRLRRSLRQGLAAWPASAMVAVLSLALSVMVWVAVTTATGDQGSYEVREVPVEAENVPRGYEASGISTEKLDVRLLGPTTLVYRVRPEDLVARVDLSAVDQDFPGTKEFTVTRPVVAAFRRTGERRVRLEPSVTQVRVTLEQLERREVRVEVRRTGAAPVGYDIESIAVEPARVRVEGSPGNVAAVDVVTADATLDGLTVSVSQSAVLVPRSANGSRIGRVTVQPETAAVKIDVKQNFYPKQVVIDVRWRGRPKTGYQVTSLRTDPATATVVGPLDQVNNLAGIATEMVDIEGADRDVVRPVRLQLPAGVTTSAQTVVATINIQPVRAPGSLGVAPRVINLAPNLSASLSTPLVALNLSGPLGDLVQLRPSDVVVTLDLAGLSAGTHRIEPRVLVPPSLQLDAVVPDRVEVIITPAR
ncbi:MAG: CdaR family protein [Dehalococcoidia bacterium]